MSSGPSQKEYHFKHVTVGSFQNFLGMAICLPTGLLTAGFLSRKLGPGDYGTLTLTVTIVFLIEMALTSGFKRSSEKLIAENIDWENIAGKALQTQLILAIITVCLLFLISPILASLLNAPEISYYLRVYAVYLPIGGLVGVYQSILVGRGHYRAKAILNGMYWIIRLVLVFLIVSINLSITAVLIANICTSILVLMLVHNIVRIPVLKTIKYPSMKLLTIVGPVSCYVVLSSFLNNMDLLFVKKYISLPQVTGYYAAAQNLSIMPELLAGALSPLLLAKVSDLMSDERHEMAKDLVKSVTRFVICLLPFAAMTAGAASEIAVTIYGGMFFETGPLLALLIFGFLGYCLRTVGIFTLIAADRPSLPLKLILPFMPVAILLYSLFVPLKGSIAAAITSLVISWSLAIIVIYFSLRLWKIDFFLITALRSILISVPIYFLAERCATPGLLLLVVIPAVCLLIPVLFILTGELSSEEMRFVLGLFTSRFRRTESSGFIDHSCLPINQSHLQPPQDPPGGLRESDMDD